MVRVYTSLHISRSLKMSDAAVEAVNATVELLVNATNATVKPWVWELNSSQISVRSNLCVRGVRLVTRPMQMLLCIL
jgi:hypothetical protein